MGLRRNSRIGSVRSRRWFSLPLLGFLFLAPLAAESRREIGSPFIRNFQQEEYAGKAQNWGMVQDGRGVVYVANQKGVLEYDGLQWRLIPTPDNLYARSVAIDAQGVVYVGGYDEFGFLALDPNGRSVYVSLTDRLPETERHFNDIMKILVTRQAVYFLAQQRMFRLANGKLDAHRIDTWERYGFVIHDDLFLIVPGRGIGVFRDDQLAILPDTARFTEPGACNVVLLPYPEGKVLILDVSHGGKFFLYDLPLYRNSQTGSYDFTRTVAGKEKVVPFPSEVSDYISTRGNFLYDAIALKNNRYALATLSGGVVVIDQRGQLERVINKNRGLLNNYVTSLMLDREQNLWLTMNPGIAHVTDDASISRFDDASGIEGAPLAVTYAQGRVFVGTAIGLYAMDDYRLRQSNDNVRFTSLVPESPELWSFQPWRDHLLVAGYPRAVLVDPDLKISGFGDNTYFSAAMSTKFPDTAFLGGSNRIEVVEFRPDRSGRPHPALVNDVFPSLDAPIRKMISDGQGGLWLTLVSKGLVHVRFHGPTVRDFTITRYGVSEGLPLNSFNFPCLVDNRLLVGTKRGIYEGIPASPDQAGAGNTRFHPEPNLGRSFNDPPVAVKGIFRDPQGRYWVDSDRGIACLAPGATRMAPGFVSGRSPGRRVVVDGFAGHPLGADPPWRVPHRPRKGGKQIPPLRSHDPAGDHRQGAEPVLGRSSRPALPEGRPVSQEGPFPTFCGDSRVELFRKRADLPFFRSPLRTPNRPAVQLPARRVRSGVE